MVAANPGEASFQVAAFQEVVDDFGDDRAQDAAKANLPWGKADVWPDESVFISVQRWFASAWPGLRRREIRSDNWAALGTPSWA
jgi:hypothetical protein